MVPRLVGAADLVFEPLSIARAEPGNAMWFATS